MEHKVNDLGGALRELCGAGEKPSRELLDRIKALGPAVVPALIEMATDEDLLWGDSESAEVWAPLHAIQLLGEMRAAEAVQPLASLLQEDSDWLSELVPEALGRIGEPALGPLRSLLFDRDEDVKVRADAAAGLAEIAHHCPELRPAVVETLVARLDPAESRTPEDEEVLGFVISELHDLGAREALPAIRRAYEEDRVDRMIIDPADVQAKLGLPREPWGEDPASEGEGLSLRLRCTSCGHERRHRVERVLCDIGTVDRQKRGEQTPYDEFIIPQRITCPKCGAVDQYQLTPFANLALTAEMMKLTMKAKGEELGLDDEESRLVIQRFGLSDGGEMHPYEARDMYREQIEVEPERADLRVRYGNVLLGLGYADESAEQYKAALRFESSNLEAYAHLAQIAMEAGDEQEACRMLEHLLVFAPASSLQDEKRDEFVDFATESLSQLGGDRSPVARLARERSGTAARQQGATRPVMEPLRVAKVGRNEPCPCGSGKKYKKCHGA